MQPLAVGPSDFACSAENRSVVEEVDRLTELPDDLLHHIMSYLDTKSAVRTSTLNSRWTSVWKEAPALNLHPKSFRNLLAFRRHTMRMVHVSFRFRSTPVHGITFNLCDCTREEVREGIVKTAEKVMTFAASRAKGLQHLSVIGDQNAASYFSIEEKTSYFCDLTDYINCSDYNSVQTLKLVQCIVFNDNKKLGFKSLTNLELRECTMPYCGCDPFDLIGELPCLKVLKVIHCEFAWNDVGLKIVGPELLELEIVFEDLPFIYHVVAPKLKFLLLWGDHFYSLPKMDFPLLDHADIRAKWWLYSWERFPEWVNQAIVNFLYGLRNAESLKLRFNKRLSTK